MRRHTFIWMGTCAAALVIGAGCRNAPAPEPQGTPAASPTAAPRMAVRELGEFGKAAATDLAWAPDERTLAVGSVDGIYLYDTQTWQVVRYIDVGKFINPEEFESTYVVGVAYSPDGSNLYFTTGQATILFRYELRSGNAVRLLKDESYSLLGDLHMAPDGRTLALPMRHNLDAGINNAPPSVATVDAGSGKTLHSLVAGVPEDLAPISAVSFSPDGHLLAAGGADNTVRVWAVDSGQLMYAVKHDGDVFSVSFSPDGSLLATAGADAVVRFWDAQSGSPLATQRGFTRPVLMLGFAPSGHRLLTVTSDGALKSWSLGEQGLPADAESVQTDPQFLPRDFDRPAVSGGPELSPSRAMLAAIEGFRVKVWDAHTGTMIVWLSEHVSWPQDIEFSPDGTLLATTDGDAQLWSLETGSVLRTLACGTYGSNVLAFAPDGRQIAVGGPYRQGCVLDVGTGRLVRMIGSEFDFSDLLAYSPDGRLLATAGWHGVQLWDSGTGSLRRTLEAQLESPSALGFSYDGSRLFLAGSQQLISWDVERGTQLLAISAAGQEAWQWMHLDAPSDLGFAKTKQPDGENLAVWELATGKRIHDYRMPGTFFYSIAVSPGGRLAARDGDGVTLFDTQSGLDLIKLEAGGSVSEMAFSPFGDMLATAGVGSEAIRLWDVSGAGRMAAGPPVSTATVFVPPVPTASPSPTPAPITSMNLPASTPPAALAGAITAANAAELTQLGVLGLGNPRSATWSGDGRTLAIGSSFGIHLFKEGQESPYRSIPSANWWSQHIALSSDGTYLAIVQDDASIGVWDSKGKYFEFGVPASCNNIDVHFDASDNLVSVCGNGSRQVHLARGGGLLETTSSSLPAYLQRSATGQFAVSGGSNMAYLYDGQDGGVLLALEVPGPEWGWIKPGISPDEQWMLVLGDARAELWRLTPHEVPELSHVLQTANSPHLYYTDMPAFSFAPDSLRVTTPCGTENLCIWDVTSGRMLARIPGADHAQFSPDGLQLFTMSVTGNVRIWNVRPGTAPQLAHEIGGFGEEIRDATFDSDGASVVSSSIRTFRAWELGSSPSPSIPRVWTLDGLSRYATVSPDGVTFASYGPGDEIQIWHAASGTRPQVLPGSDSSPGYISALTFSRDGRRLSAGGPHSMIRTWDVASRELLYESRASDSIVELAYSPDGRFLAASAWDGTGRTEEGGAIVWIWEASTGTFLQQLDRGASHLAFHPDGVTLAAGGDGGRVVLLDIRTGSKLANWTALENVTDMAFNPDGTILAMVTAEGLELWDAEAGQRVRHIEARASCVSFSPRCDLLALCNLDATVGLYGLPPR